VSERLRAQRRDVLEDLRQQGRFSDVILVAWAIIEMNLDQAILAVYRLSTHDPRSNLVLNARVDEKLDLLKALSHLDQVGRSRIREFQLERNRLFHKSKGLFILNLPESERDRLMRGAIKAVNASHDLSDSAREEQSHGR
jgi:hypothetical protein